MDLRVLARASGLRRRMRAGAWRVVAGAGEGVGKWGAGAYDFKGVRDDADGHELLAVVAAVHHERVGEALDDGTLGFAEALHGVSAGGVGGVDGCADLDVVAVESGLA